MLETKFSRDYLGARQVGVGRTVSRSASVRRSRGLTRRDFRSTGGNSIIRVPRQSVARKVRTPLETPPRHRWLPSVSSRGPSNFPHTASITAGSSLFFHDESLWSLSSPDSPSASLPRNFRQISSNLLPSVQRKEKRTKGIFSSFFLWRKFFFFRERERERLTREFLVKFGNDCVHVDENG